MCGIIGIVGNEGIGTKAIRGLERLEYRGYDSAGIGYSGKKKNVVVKKTLNGVSDLRSVAGKVESGTIIGHSRWATHGVVSIENAHPHNSGNSIALVHNGIIENHKEIRDKLEASGVEFSGDTDTETIVHDIKSKHSGCWFTAMVLATMEMKGAYAIAMVAKNENTIYLAKQGSPLIIGVGDGENYISSSMDGLVGLTDEFIIMDDGQYAKITANDITVIDADGKEVEKNIHKALVDRVMVELGEGDSYMMKEIEEQPDVILNTIVGSDGDTDEIFGLGSKQAFGNVKSIKIVACGTSYNAGVIGKYWIEEHCGIRCDVEIASELVYRERAIVDNELCIFISQSGETADTIAAIKSIKDEGCKNTLAICNTRHSELVRQAHYSFITRAGYEVGVASTKAFTTQLIALCSICDHIRLSRGEVFKKMIDADRLIMGIKHVIEKKDQLLAISREIATHQSCLFIGRGTMYPIAMEGALKLKEISYIHAEAYAGGELKHGPLALIDENMPVVALTFGGGDGKMVSNIEEIKSRKGKVYVFDECGHNSVISPILMTVYMQILAYQVGIILGRNIDKPRNLAKSVTVE
jgi:glucosamine--fructose-6-phosphate aminotransferase (isomerizing)